MNKNVVYKFGPCCGTRNTCFSLSDSWYPWVADFKEFSYFRFEDNLYDGGMHKHWSKCEKDTTRTWFGNSGRGKKATQEVPYLFVTAPRRLSTPPTRLRPYVISETWPTLSKIKIYANYFTTILLSTTTTAPYIYYARLFGSAGVWINRDKI